ncbi:NADH-quinone oxidoreductase subunit C [Streptomyces sp. NPDC088763]|uniref:NADH-quinone oxidoreductase subunit C n=1 Tax=Streptomyces sp. NPDC088763 TaxID=3365892 RepID=UPI0037FE0094
MTTVGWLPTPVEELFGPEATAEESYDVLTVDVPPAAWITALETARDSLGCTYFDWLSAVDEPGTGFRVAAHVAALAPVRRLLVRTTVPHESPALPSAVGVYAGAAWHERETHEMFGVDFTDHPGLDHLLLPENFEGHPLRKDFVLAARVAKAWPGAKEPGESEHGGPKRRQMLPPGVPDPNEWGPLKGQLPPAPARPARAAGRTAGERPVRRTRSAAEGSASQAGTTPDAVAGTAGAAAGDTPAAGTRPRRTRTAAQGSASQTAPATEAAPGSTGPSAEPATADAPTQPGTSETPAETGIAEPSTVEPGPAAPPARRSRSASEGSASQRTPASSRRSRSASEGSASQQRPAPEAQAPATPAPGPAPAPEDGPATAAAAPDDATTSGTTAAPDDATTSGTTAAPDDATTSGTTAAPDAAAPGTATPRTPRSPDAPWHHARPAFEEPSPEAEKPTGPQPAKPQPVEPQPAEAEGEQQDDREGQEGRVRPDDQEDREGQENREGQEDQEGQEDRRAPRPDEGTDPAGGPR